MSNRYYNNDSTTLTDGTTASASDVETKFTEIATSFTTLQADLIRKDGSDTLTGDLTLYRDPQTGLHAATKQYVDGLSQGTLTFTANSNVSAGQAVAIRVADGQIEPVSSSDGSLTVNTAVTVGSLTNHVHSKIVYCESEQRICLVSSNSATYATHLGTSDGSTTSWDVVANITAPSGGWLNIGGANRIFAMDWDVGQSRLVFVGQEAGTYDIYAVEGTIGTYTVSWGTPYLVSSTPANLCGIDVAYDTNINRHLVCYQNTAGSYAIALTLSSGTFSKGSELTGVHSTNLNDNMCLVWNPDELRFAAGFADSGNGYIRVVNLAIQDSDQSIIKGSEDNSVRAYADAIGGCYDTINDQVIFASGYGYGTGVSISSFTMSGSGMAKVDDHYTTSIDTSVYQVSMIHNPDTEKMYVMSGGTSVDITEVTNTGTALGFGTPEEIYISYGYGSSLTYDTVNNVIISHYNRSGAEASVIEAPAITTNAGNTIGIAAEAITATNSGSVNVVGGKNTHVSGLTTGTQYYVEYDGTITASPNTSYTYKTLGRALSSTSILIEGIS